MRCSRLQRSTKLRRKAAVRLISLLPFSTVFCLSLIAPPTPSYAWMKSQLPVKACHMTAAFVFPNTVQAVADKVKSDTQSVQELVLGVRGIVLILPTLNEQQRAPLLRLTQQRVREAQILLDDAVALTAEIQQYSVRAQIEQDKAQADLTRLQQTFGTSPNDILEAESKLKSAQRVIAYVLSAYQQAKSAIHQYQIVAPLLSFNGIDLQPTVTQTVYGETVTGEVYEKKASVTPIVNEANVTGDIYGEANVPQSVYGSEVHHSVYGPPSVTSSTYDTPPHFNFNEAKSEFEHPISPVPPSESIPQVPLASPTEIISKINSNGRTNRKVVNFDGAVGILTPKE